MTLEHQPKTIVVSQTSMSPNFRQAHEFIFSSQSYSSTEELIISLLCSRENVQTMSNDITDVVDSVRGQPKAYLFETEILEEYFNTPAKNLYSRLETATRNLMQTQTTHDSDGKAFTHENLFTRCVFNAKGLYLLPSQAFYDRLFLSTNGFAEIDQQAFISVRTNQHSMRLFRILSRFKTGDKKLYAFDVEKLKSLFGIYDDDGNVLKKSYVQTSTFLSKILIPAIKTLSDTDVVSHRLKFHYDEADKDKKHIGIRKHSVKGKVTHIEFLYEWFEVKNHLPQTYNYSKEQFHARLQELIKKRSRIELSIDELYETKVGLEYFNHHELAQKFELEIQEKLERESKKQTDEKDELDFDFLKDL